MAAPQRLPELLGRFTGSSEEFHEVEYVGTFRVSGDVTLRVIDDAIADGWRRSVVPDVYMPLYGLKSGPPEYAGGLFEAAPFAPYDPDNMQYVAMNAPPPLVPIFDLCTDRSGCPFWVSSDCTVFGHNLDNEIQRIGSLAAFVDFALSLTLDGIPWCSRLNDPDTTNRFGLSRISTMG